PSGLVDSVKGILLAIFFLEGDEGYWVWRWKTEALYGEPGRRRGLQSPPRTRADVEHELAAIRDLVEPSARGSKIAFAQVHGVWNTLRWVLGEHDNAPLGLGKRSWHHAA